MRVFLEAARTGSVSLAAERCHLSQPAATQAITRLESDLGAPLLIRRRQQFSLTNCGAAFERRVAAALNHLHDGARAALRANGETSRRRPTFDHSVTAAQLRNLIAIADTGSFTVAARKLGLSQPTVHRTARSLEAIAGVPLFTQVRKPLFSEQSWHNPKSGRGLKKSAENWARTRAPLCLEACLWPGRQLFPKPFTPWSVRPPAYRCA
ncbi:MAG: LysR family transcriptional regulator [Rhodobacteraceae bacterium]|nr:LysR family transcriptional regulator [Paracoccaceae bacterium]